MSRSSTLVLLGVLTVLAPLSGLPSSFRTLLAAVLGASVMGIGLAMRTRPAKSVTESESASEEPSHSAAPPPGMSPI
ncbi:MAG: hypothetical protein WC030_01175 [Candidatus Paceibacterota bacterium]